MTIQLIEDRRRILVEQWCDDRVQICRWINEGGALMPHDETDGFVFTAATSACSAGPHRPEDERDMMRFDVRSHRPNRTDPLRAFATERLRAALHRFRHRVDRVTLFVTDVNGPRGGTDKRVRLIIGLRPSGSVIITAINANAFVAVARAARRAGHSVKRELRRRRTSRLLSRHTEVHAR
jgi:hypothetical protein